MAYIEHDGVLYEGPSTSWPEKVWRPQTKEWVPYGGDVPKPQGWGEIISDADAKGLMGEAS